MKRMSRGLVINPRHSAWIVPRRVMCAFFWVGIVFLFSGVILLVTSKHRGRAYLSWGSVLLALGFCLLVICFVLCVHAYCVITVSDEEVARKAVAQFHSLPPPSPFVNGRALDTPDSVRRVSDPHRLASPRSQTPLGLPDMLNEHQGNKSKTTANSTDLWEPKSSVSLPKHPYGAKHTSLKIHRAGNGAAGKRSNLDKLASGGTYGELDHRGSPKKIRSNCSDTKGAYSGAKTNPSEIHESLLPSLVTHRPPTGPDGGKYSVRLAEKRLAPSFSARVTELPIIHEDPISNGGPPQVRVFPAKLDKYNYTVVSTVADDEPVKRKSTTTRSSPSTRTTTTTDSNVAPKIPPPPFFKSRSRNNSNGSNGSSSSYTSSDHDGHGGNLIEMDPMRAISHDYQQRSNEDSASSVMSEETSSSMSLPTVVFLSNEHGITESKVSIYDNVQYIHL